MKKLFFLASLVSLACLSSKSKKEAVKTAEITPIAYNTAETPVTYRLIVSFISKGAGTDHEKRTAFLKYVDSHPKKPKYKTAIWGREGEADYCFKLSEFKSKKELAKFINDIKKMAVGTDMMSVSENAECPHKGR